MSADQSGPAVVAFGDGEPVPDRPMSGRFGNRLRRLAADRRVAPVVAALAGVAGFGSLVAPWYSIVMPMGDVGADGSSVGTPMTFMIMDVGSLGTAYLFGLLVLAVGSTLALLGPPAARPAIRLGGLTLIGGLVAVLVALTMTIGHSMERNFFGQDVDLDVDGSPGLTAAFATLVLAALTFYLVGQGPVGPVRPDSPAPAAPDWAWQAPRPGRDETAAEIAAAAPLDLTVEPARPFLHPESDDGRPR
ncbi:hypothetical protein AB0J74_24125 [Asanoa sp. NPDC049573]|uniref:hypothetical protein n=1 Tax=Asanoa sp. NPDC049573 TaxID=3155396 RepID=UPI00343F9BD7